MIIKNYLKTYINLIYPMDCLMFRWSYSYPLLLKKQRLAQPLYPTIMPLSIRYLITNIYNKTDNHLSAMLLKYQALLSSLCFVPMIQTPFDKNFYEIEPQKYISANRFNKLNYKTMINKCK